MLSALFILFDFFKDLNLIIKLFVLLTIISFVRNHVGNKAIGLAIIGGVSWFVFFANWAFFGGTYVLYMLLMFGISGILIDFFFVTGGGGGQESPVSSGVDLLKRRQMMNMMAQQKARMRRPPAG